MPWILLPALVSLVIHFGALFGEFVWDDVDVVKDHPQLQEPGFIREIFRRDYGQEMADRGPVGYYRPFLMLVNVLLAHLVGVHAWAYRAFSLLVGCASVTLLAWVLHRLRPGEGLLLPVVAATLVALHPVRTEMYCFFMTLPDLLSEIYGLLLVFILVRSDMPAEGRRRFVAGFPCVLLLSFLAGITKESLFVVVAAMAASAIVYGSVRRGSRRVAALGVCMLLGLGLAYGLRHFAGVDATPAGIGIQSLVTQGSGRALSSLALAVRQIIIPSPVIFMDWTDHAPSLAAAAGVVLVGACFAAVLLALVWKRQLMHLLLTAWTGASLLSLMMVTAVQIPYSDRYIALAPAMIEVCFLGRWLIRRIAAVWPGARDFFFQGRARFVVLAVYGCLFGGFTLQGTAKCMGQVSFFAAMADDNPRMAYPRIVLAHVMMSDYGNFEQMEFYAREAISLSPDTIKGRELGKLFAMRYVVETNYVQALQYLSWSEQVLTNDAEVLSLKAISLSGLGRKGDALASIRRAISLEPQKESYKRQLLLIEQATNTLSRGRNP